MAGPTRVSIRCAVGLAAQLASGADLNRPYWLCLMAEPAFEPAPPGKHWPYSTMPKPPPG